ncbi:natural cytotoxicity triggering receptor 2 isoform X2 [Loxodonta africana]|uniref:natural cytotoxicity triggering receptor 2 isoform X2 n=1 Tax=Loxodonta africana TaxID=9785 RepID=UPI0030D50B74
MALEPPYMLLVLLALVSGSWVQRLEAELQQGVAGETLTVTCWYLNKGGQYEAKVWCKANSDGCEYLIVISKPRTLVQDTQYMIWDDPDSGFLNITMNKLTEQDSGTYWCGIVNTSANSVTKIREISLEVSPERMLGSAPNNGSNDRSGSFSPWPHDKAASPSGSTGLLLPSYRTQCCGPPGSAIPDNASVCTQLLT